MTLRPDDTEGDGPRESTEEQHRHAGRVDALMRQVVADDAELLGRLAQ